MKKKKQRNQDGKFWDGIVDQMKTMPPGTYKIHNEVIIRSPFSVYFVNYRVDYPDNYPAKFDEELARYLIQTWTKPGDIVLDPMAGSGTIPLIALSLGREAIYQDINEEARELYRKKCGRPFAGEIADSRKSLFCNDNQIDLILTSPPFGLSIDATHDKYSDNPDDLGNAKDYSKWRAGMKKILANCYKALKPGKLCIVETRPRSKAGHTYPLNMWIYQDGLDVGFEFYFEMIEVVDYYRMVSYGSADMRKPIPKHAYLTMMRKPVNEKLPNM